MREHNWKKESTDGLMQIFSHHVFGRHPYHKLKPAKKAEFLFELPCVAPIGFQLHFIDIFMEELAKVGGEEIKKKTLMKLLAPFMYELAFNEDDRILDEIKIRIFHHIIHQSDAGIQYQESLHSNGNSVKEEVKRSE